MSSDRRARLSSLILPAIVIALALAARAAAWPDVFTDRGVSFRADTDPLYHVLRAERIASGAPGAPWRDPALAWPTGADIPWPPLFDALIAISARLFASAPGREDFARAGAILPVVLGLIAIPLVAAVGRRLLGSRLAGWAAAFLAAVIPALEQQTEVGRPDQHAAEQLLFVAILLAFLVAVERRGRSSLWVATGFGLLVAVGFWTWMGSAVLLAVPAVFTAAWHLLVPSEERREASAETALCAGGAVGAILLAVTLALFGPPGALTSASATGISGLHVAMCLGTGAMGGTLLLASRRRPSEGRRLVRLAEVLVALGTPLLLTLGLSGSLREGTARGLVALFAANPWYRYIGEFQPLLSGDEPIGVAIRDAIGSFGLTLPAAALGLPALRARWRRPEERLAVTFIAVTAALFVPLMLARQRFMSYALLPLALACIGGFQWSAERLAARIGERRGLRRAVVIGLAVVVALPSASELGLPWRSVSTDEEDALRWLAFVPVSGGREGVLSQWSLGHAIQYYASRPVVASPFGTEGGSGSMEAWARFWFARDGEAAEAVLAERRAGIVLLRNPVSELVGCGGLAPPEIASGITLERNVISGETWHVAGGVMQFVPSRLYFADGTTLPNGTEALSGFRLLYETPAGAGRSSREDQVKIFGVVPGARLTVRARPGETVEASVRVRTNHGREFTYRTASPASPQGLAVLRLPYSSGKNGAVSAGAWTVLAGRSPVTVAVTADAVESGGALALQMSK